MKRNLVLVAIFFTIFLDFFNLGLIYPLFTALIFEGDGGMLSHASDFSKNTVFGLLIAAFPFGQFLGAPGIGHLSDQFGRRRLLIYSLMGTVATLSVCALGVFLESLPLLFLGRFLGGLMAGNITLAYASLADFSTDDDKVKNFALIPFAMGVGFAGGPYVAGILANPETHSLAGPTLPFLAATLLALVNLGLAFWKFPETLSLRKQGGLFDSFSGSFNKLWGAFKQAPLRPFLWILFLMISSNFLFVQFVGPLTIERFGFNVTEVGYLYANIGIACALGHLCLTRTLAGRFAPEVALKWSLLALSCLLFFTLIAFHPLVIHALSFLILLACAVAYTNAMALVSNQAGQAQQGEIMGVAVAIQSFAEFFPASILGFFAFLSQMLPLLVAALLAAWGFWMLTSLKKKVIAVHEGVRDLF